MNKGDLDAALFNLTRALEINPKYSDAVYSIGLIQAIKGDLVSSQLSFKKAIELNPEPCGHFRNDKISEVPKILCIIQKCRD